MEAGVSTIVLGVPDASSGASSSAPKACNEARPGNETGKTGKTGKILPLSLPLSLPLAASAS
jgi:hypothetical protein